MRLIGCLALVGLLGLLGCHKDPNRHDVSGRVTFQGQPVPRGQVIFYPDLAKGNNGPQGYAEIVDGHYDTRNQDKGAPAGPVIVLIGGYDGQVKEGQPYGKALFVDYRVSVELPPESTQKDFDVPASAAESLRKLSATPP
jgi:hypothetical protein